MVKSALLDQEELGKWAGVILKCSKEDSEEVLADYPGGAASENTIDWKREHVALELCFSSMSTAVLLDLGAKGFGIDTKNFELWLRFYAEAYGQKIAQDVLLSSLSTSTHDNARKVSSAEMRRKHIVANTMSVLSAMREEILNECPDIERNQERYNDLAVVTNELLARVES